jgi:hypothetical protein
VCALPLPPRQRPAAVDRCLSREQSSYQMPGAAEQLVSLARLWPLGLACEVSSTMDSTTPKQSKDTYGHDDCCRSRADIPGRGGRRAARATPRDLDGPAFSRQRAPRGVHDSVRGHDVDLSPVWTRCWERPSGACTSTARSVTSWSTREPARSRRGGEAFLLRQNVRRPDNVSVWPACEELCPVLRGGATRPEEISLEVRLHPALTYGMVLAPEQW